MKNNVMLGAILIAFAAFQPASAFDFDNPSTNRSLTETIATVSVAPETYAPQKIAGESAENVKISKTYTLTISDIKLPLKDLGRNEYGFESEGRTLSENNGTGIINFKFFPGLEQIEQPLREVNFKSQYSWDENGYSTLSCSKKDEKFTINDDEWRTEKQEGFEQYICKYMITYSCRWKNCTVPYPHTSPDICNCKVLCSSKAQKTDECHWQPIR